MPALDRRSRYIQGHSRNLADKGNYLHSDHNLVPELTMAIKTCLDPGAEVLEVGCGGGHAAAFLDRLGFKVMATDFSPVAVETARTKYPGLDFREAEATRLGFADSSFDGVLAVDLIEHMERPADHVKEVWRVLRPGGVYFVKTPNRLLHDVYYRGNPATTDWHPSVMSPKELASLLAAGGFHPRFVRMERLPAYQLNKILAKVAPLAGLAKPVLSRLPLGLLPIGLQPSLICVAVKENEPDY